MWVPWVKRSPAHHHTKSSSTNTFSFDDHPPPSPINHHSPSLKDIETLFNHHPPLTPVHKHSLSSIPFAAVPQSPVHHSVSLKDIHSLLSDYPAQTHSQTQTRKPSVFHRVKTWAHRQSHHSQPPPPPDSQNRVVVYFTSLHAVRRTYEDCRTVRLILKGYRVKMDERDLSMDGRYIEELQRITPPSNGKKSSVPRVYVNGKCLGGVEEIRRLHENGELKRMIQGLELDEGEEGICRLCGGYRYVVCEWCDGSHRRYVEEKSGFKNCNMCNVNGLILCGFCTSVGY